MACSARHFWTANKRIFAYYERQFSGKPLMRRIVMGSTRGRFAAIAARGRSYSQARLTNRHADCG